MFTLTKIEGGRINVFEPQILTVGTEAVVAGQALVLDSNGLLVKCGAEVKPTFVAIANGAAGAEIPVGRVESNQIYSVDAVSGLKVGAKVKTDGNGKAITATASTAGGAEIVAVDTTTNTAYIRFV